MLTAAVFIQQPSAPRHFVSERARRPATCLPRTAPDVDSRRACAVDARSCSGDVIVIVVTKICRIERRCCENAAGILYAFREKYASWILTLMYRAESTKVIVYIIVVARHYRNREFGSFGSAESADHRTQSQPDKVDYQETHITYRQVGEKRLSVT